MYTFKEHNNNFIVMAILYNSFIQLLKEIKLIIIDTILDNVNKS